MSTTVPSVDNGQIWLPLKKLQAMTRLENEATLAVSGKKTAEVKDIQDWTFRSLNFLLKDIKDLIKTKSIGQSIFYAILFFLGMLAIFDTQVLAIFRRRKEMGTLMALGFTRAKVIQLFTVEGALHGILAAGVAAIYGIPLLTYFSVNGWTLPANTESFGFTVGEKIFPTYSAGLILGTTILVMLVTTVVSFLPTRKIAKLKPTEALRGKLP
jgi:ABC-type antimicrobial peptide transport system permease subunit